MEGKKKLKERKLKKKIGKRNAEKIQKIAKVGRKQYYNVKRKILYRKERNEMEEII